MLTHLIWDSVAAVVVAAGAIGVTAVAARRAGRISVVDVTWGAALAAIAVVTALIGGGDVPRRILLVVLTAGWGLRLSGHILRRSRGAGEDPRYAEILRTGSAFRRVWLPQGVALWLVSIPLQIGCTLHAGLGPTDLLGVIVFLVGVGFEAVGDAQLAAYKRDPDRPPIMDRGLWAWTRHPNYFGDACVWWGIWLVSVHQPWTLAGIVSPVTMTWFLYAVTGAKLLERTMGRRPGYAEYAARTSMFIPRPPRRVS